VYLLVLIRSPHALYLDEKVLLTQSLTFGGITQHQSGPLYPLALEFVRQRPLIGQ